MIARFKRMQGYNVFYPFGFDDNGLPTERLVEKDEGIIANQRAMLSYHRNYLLKTTLLMLYDIGLPIPSLGQIHFSQLMN